MLRAANHQSPPRVSLDPAAPPTAFAVKFAKVIPGTFSFNEVEVLRTLQDRSPASVLSAHLLNVDPIRGRADGAQLAMIAMEPCDGSLLDLRSSEKGTDGLSPAAAAAVTRAAFEDCASLWAAVQRLHMDVKPGNFLYSCTSANSEAGDCTYHVFAADFGSLVQEGALCCTTFSSPAAARAKPPAHWSHVAFQLGAMCFWLLKAQGGSEHSCAEFKKLQNCVRLQFLSQKWSRGGQAAVATSWTQLLDLMRGAAVPEAFIQLLNGLMSFDEGRTQFLNPAAAPQRGFLDDAAKIRAMFDAYSQAAAPPAQPGNGGAGAAAELRTPVQPSSGAGAGPASASARQQASGSRSGGRSLSPPSVRPRGRSPTQLAVPRGSVSPPPKGRRSHLAEAAGSSGRGGQSGQGNKRLRAG